jgi:glycosyltransferase involved in cell wall biosynthesis
VEFQGYKSGDELNKIVSGAEHVVVPSLWHDNAPNVVYESFAAGKPVIASALGGLREQVTADTGILVSPGDVEDLAKALKRMSQVQGLTEELGRAARRKVEEEHRIDSHAEQLLGLFERTMHGGK